MADFLVGLVVVAFFVAIGLAILAGIIYFFYIIGPLATLAAIICPFLLWNVWEERKEAYRTIKEIGRAVRNTRV